METEEYYAREHQLFVLRWVARIIGTLEAVLLFYVFSVEFWEEVRANSPSPLLTMINGQYFLFVTLTLAFTGLIIAYRYEWLGGGIGLAAWVVLFIGWRDFHGFFIASVILAALPAALYLAYGLMNRSLQKKWNRKQGG